jgi:hypothetical protein
MHVKKEYREIEVYLHTVEHSQLDGAEMSDSCSGRFIPGELIFRTHLIGS